LPEKIGRLPRIAQGDIALIYNTLQPYKNIIYNFSFNSTTNV
jgi:hypothetical protein